jgi:hypothetical protein
LADAAFIVEQAREALSGAALLTTVAVIRIINPKTK